MTLLSRRQVILGTTTVLVHSVATLSDGPSYAQITQIHPNPSTLLAGDLLWVRPPSTCVLYHRVASASDAVARWSNAVNNLAVRAKNRNDHFLEAAAQSLSTMTEDQFNYLYLENRPLNTGVRYSGNGLSIGHVAIVGSTSDGLYVIEATTPDSSTTIDILEQCFENGVKKTPYSSWIAAHGTDLVWHGRPYPSMSDDKRSQIPIEALKYLGRPYCFDALNMTDISGFYCSKLVWLCIRDALGRYVDDNPDPRRKFWLSPKQILESKNVYVQFNPGHYGCFP